MDQAPQDRPPANAAEAFRHIADLLKVGMFQVHHAKFVSDACSFLEGLAVSDEKAREAADAQPTQSL